MKTNSSFLTVIFLFVCFSGFGQSNKINVGFKVYTNLADRFVELESLQDLEDPKLVVSFGAVVTYRLNPKWSLISGLDLLNKGYQRKFSSSDLRWGLQQDGNGGFNPGINPMEYLNSQTIKNNYYFLAIPFNVRYALGESLDKSWFFQGGFAPAFYLFDQTKVIQYTDDGKSVDTHLNKETSLRKVNLNLNLGFGYAFLIKEKFQISVEPGFEYMPFGLAKNTLFKSNYYSYGLTTRFMIL